MHLARAHGFVEVLDVAESEELQVVVARVHLLDHPFERLCGLLRIGDDRCEQVRDARIRAQLHALGIDHDQAHLLGRGTHDDRHEHRIDEARLSGAGGARHQQVRHLGQVGGDEMALHVLADAGEHGVRVIHRLVGAQHVAEVDDLAVIVRDFDADRRFSGDRREDAHIGAGHRVGDVALQVRDLLDLDARAELDLVLGDGRAAQEADDFRVDVELLERGGQRADHAVIGRRAHGMRLAVRQHVQVGQLVRGVRRRKRRVVHIGIHVLARTGRCARGGIRGHGGNRTGSARGGHRRPRIGRTGNRR